MKSILISVKPKYCELIASGKKTVEVRKTRPKLDTPFKCYIYCTKGDWLTSVNGKVQKPNCMVIDLSTYNKTEDLNGKVIGEFVCDRIQEITYAQIYNFGRYKNVCEAETKLDFYALDDYLNQANGYGWHISDLVIYDKPRELGEFKLWDCTTHFDENGYPEPTHEIKRPFQSWGYVESEESV